MNGCFKTLQQLQKHILGAHVVIEPSRSVKLETTQTTNMLPCGTPSEIPYWFSLRRRRS